MKQKTDFKILRHLRKHNDRWFELRQLTGKLHIPYNLTRITLNNLVKEGLVRLDKWKMDGKGHPLNIYRYKKDALDKLIVDKAHKKT